MDPRAVRPDHVIAYLVRFTDHGPDTCHRYFREVRCFCNWLRTAGYTTNDPFRGLRNVRPPQKIVPPFTPAEIQTLLAGCSAGTPMGSRDRALLLTLLDTGLRCAAAVALDLADCGTAPGPLFLAARYGRLHPGVGLGISGLKHRLQALGREAGVPRVHAHRFRHTFATWAIAHDARELDVQHLLGHRSPELVRRYSATYRSAQAAERHQGFSPGDQMLTGPR